MIFNNFIEHILEIMFPCLLFSNNLVFARKLAHLIIFIFHSYEFVQCLKLVVSFIASNNYFFMNKYFNDIFLYNALCTLCLNIVLIVPITLQDIDFDLSKNCYNYKFENSSQSCYDIFIFYYIICLLPIIISIHYIMLYYFQ
jgi:hypothetical protein